MITEVDIFSLSGLVDLGSIIVADIVLSGDNALVIALAASGLPPHLRRWAIMFGMLAAALLRIIFALIATKLLDVPGLLFIGALLLLWICWRLYGDIRRGHSSTSIEHTGSSGDSPSARTTLSGALWTISIADVSMSLDNVLAVAAIAEGDTFLLVFGLGLAILLMAFAATIIMGLLTRYPWISWLGLVVLLYVALDMLWRGIFDEPYGVYSLVLTYLS